MTAGSQNDSADEEEDEDDEEDEISDVFMPLIQFWIFSAR